MISSILPQGTRRRSTWISRLTALLIALHLLYPVDAFATSPSAPSFIARQQNPSPITSSRPKHLQNRVTLFSSSISTENRNQNPIRKVTGLPLTALRTTLRTATGFSLTTLRATLRAATGISLSQQLTTLISTLTGILPAGVRYFLQPFLIMYYAPMMIVRYYMVGPSNKYVEESQRGHERVVQGWRKAVEAAERAQEGGYWPVHLNG
jgi:hypothetical protein